MGDNMSKISVVGLGKMGAALAANLIASGRSVTVWNRSEGKAGPLVALGAQEVASLQDAIAASDVIITCVKTHKTTIDMLTPLAADLSGKPSLTCPQVAQKKRKIWSKCSPMPVRLGRSG